MPAVWKSTHPDVLAWWEDLNKRSKKYQRECRKVEKQFGRGIVLRTGFGDERPMGLTRAYKEPLLPGWKFGWGKRDSGFMEPRYSANKEHSKEVCEAAQAVIRKLVDLHPDVRQEAEDRFGVPDCVFMGLHALSPGYFEHNGTLWVTFGTHDFEPDLASRMTQYFEPAKKSEYYAAREDAGLEEESA